MGVTLTPASRIAHVSQRPGLAYEVVSDREERDDETDAQTSMRVIAVTQPGVDIEARWVKKAASRFLVINSIHWLITMVWC